MNAPLTTQIEPATRAGGWMRSGSNRHTRRPASAPRSARVIALPAPQPSVGERAALAFLLTGAAIALAQALGIVEKLHRARPALEGWVSWMFS